MLDFLGQYITQADLLDMTEREAYVTLPNFLQKRTVQQFSAARNGSIQSEGISPCCPPSTSYYARMQLTNKSAGI